MSSTFPATSPNTFDTPVSTQPNVSETQGAAKVLGSTTTLDTFTSTSVEQCVPVVRASLSQHQLQDLRDYLARPRLISSAAFTVVRGLQVSHKIDSSFIASSFPDFFVRLSGVYGVRFSLRFRLIVNSTPFHAGLACMCFQHGSCANGTTFPRFSLACSSTDVPHVRTSYSDGASVELLVPMILSSDVWPLSSPLSFGTLALHNLVNNIVPTGTTAATYTLYVGMEDISLFGAMPQATSVVTLQSGANAESDAALVPVSAAVAHASSTLSMFSRAVPSLRGFTQPLSWMTSILAGSLKAFGFSKPPVLGPPARTVKFSSVAEFNVDEPSQVLTLGPLASQRLAIDSTLGCTDIDEMALAYVLARPSQIFCGYWGTNYAQYSVVYATQVSPLCFWYRTTATSAGTGNLPLPDFLNPGAVPLKATFKPSNILYFASMFRQWRGCVSFRITIAKTPYHTGKLLATFIPAASGTSANTSTVVAPATTGGLGNGYSAVFDLREGSVFEFDCPYIQDRPLLDFDESSGSFSVRILSPMLAPSNAPAALGLIVEVFSKDMTFVGPRAPIFPPTVFPTSTLYEQSGVLACNYAESIDEVTAGEKIMSLKQLIMIPTTTGVEMGYPAKLPPWWFTNYTPDTYVGRPVCNTLTYGSVVAQCFLFCRGASEYHLSCSDSAVSVTLQNQTRNPVTRGLWAQRSFSSRPTVCTAPRADYEGAHIRCAHYIPVVRMEVGALRRRLDVNTVWSPATNPHYAPGQVLSWNPNLSGIALTAAEKQEACTAIPDQFVILEDQKLNVALSTSASDDAYCGHFMGAPVCFLSGENTIDTIYDSSYYWLSIFTPASALPAEGSEQQASELPPISENSTAPSFDLVPVNVDDAGRTTALTATPPTALRTSAEFIRKQVLTLDLEMKTGCPNEGIQAPSS